MTLKTSLYKFQEPPVNKLIPLKIGALYMEMGTGKTRTALEIVMRRYNAGRIDKILWLCPCHVKTTITRELKKHIAEGIEAFEIHGIESLSSSVALNEYLLEFVQKYRIMLVVDESSLVKNHTAKRTVNIKRLAGYCPYRLILNGTPISRNEADLYAQWDILDWRVLGYRSFWSFAANHIEYDTDNPQRIRRCLNIDCLSKKIASYTYQIRKDECLTLPPKIEQTRYFDLTDDQTEHYDAVIDFYLPPPETEDWQSEAIYRLFTACQQTASGRYLNLMRYVLPISTSPFFDRPSDNPRIETLFNVINETEGKVLIWCKYTHEIKDVAAELMRLYGSGSVALLYGDLNQKKRGESLERFEGPARFLVGNKSCGGFGLNLQFCSNVIYYNNDFDWAGRAQSEDRVHRIGQNSNVCITNICAAYTIDEKVLANLQNKTHLVDSFKREIDKIKDRNSYVRESMKGSKQ